MRDSLAKIEPQMSIIVNDIANRTYKLDVFTTGGTDVAGLVPENQLAYFNLRKIQAIVRPRSFFKKR